MYPSPAPLSAPCFSTRHSGSLVARASCSFALLAGLALLVCLGASPIAAANPKPAVESQGRASTVTSISPGSGIAGTWRGYERPYPAFQQNAVLAFDTRRNRLWMLADNKSLWYLQMGDPPVWRLSDVSGQLLSGHGFFFLHYDARDDRLLLLQSAESGSPNIGLWQLPIESGTWARIAVGSPGPIGPATYWVEEDLRRGRLLLYGGAAPGPPARTDGLWELVLHPGPLWRQIVTPGPMPPHRDVGALIRDARRDQLLLPQYPDLWVLPADGTGTWTREMPIDNGYFLKYMEDLFAVYDSVNDRVILHYTGPDRGPRLLGLKRRDSGEWTFPRAAGSGEYWAHGRKACFDMAHQRILAFGSDFDVVNQRRNDATVYALDDTIRFVTLTRGPSETAGMRLVYDPRRDELLSCGGNGVAAVSSSGANISYDQGLWSAPAGDLQTWTRHPSLGRGGEGLGLIYDPGLDRLAIFGGKTYTFGCPSRSYIPHYAPGMALSTPDGADRQVVAGTPLRAGFAATLDEARHRLLMFGGEVATFLGCNDSPSFNRSRFGDIQEFSLNSSEAWRVLPSAVTAPSARHGSQAIYDALRDRLVLFGVGDGGRQNELWLATGTDSVRWSQAAPTGDVPPPMSKHAFIYDESRDRAILYGYSEAQPEAEIGAGLWALSLGTFEWTRLTTDVPGPGARLSAGVAYDSRRDRLVILGGYARNQAESRTVWALEWGDPARSVSIRVLPGALTGAGAGAGISTLPVVIPGSATFNPRDIDPATVRVNGAAARIGSALRVDYEADGWEDLIVEVSPAAMDPTIPPGRLRFEARTLSGERLFGMGSAGPEIQPVLTPRISLISGNPAHADNVLLKIDLPGDAPARMDILNVEGRLCGSQFLSTDTPGTHVVALPAARGLARGIYFLRLTQGSRSSLLKLVLTR